MDSSLISGLRNTAPRCTRPRGVGPTLYTSDAPYILVMPRTRTDVWHTDANQMNVHLHGGVPSCPDDPVDCRLQGIEEEQRTHLQEQINELEGKISEREKRERERNLAVK